MTTNFTIRDFFVYLLTGCISVVSICLVFHEKIFPCIEDWYSKHELISDNISFLAAVFLIPTIYFWGHIIGIINYGELKVFACIDKKFKKTTTKQGKEMPKWKYYILMLFQKLFYRHRNVFAIVQYYCKRPSDRKRSVNDFWTDCAKLQAAQVYRPAEYWYILTDFFSALRTNFILLGLASFVSEHKIISIAACAVLSYLTHKRAKQYAENFVNTVIRLRNAQDSIINK
jgi:hypothetical protein